MYATTRKEKPFSLQSLFNSLSLSPPSSFHSPSKALATTSNTSSANRRISGSCSRAVDLHLSRYCNSASKCPPNTSKTLPCYHFLLVMYETHIAFVHFCAWIQSICEIWLLIGCLSCIEYLDVLDFLTLIVRFEIFGLNWGQAVHGLGQGLVLEARVRSEPGPLYLWIGLEIVEG